MLRGYGTGIVVKLIENANIQTVSLQQDKQVSVVSQWLHKAMRQCFLAVLCFALKENLDLQHASRRTTKIQLEQNFIALDLVM